MTPGPRAARAHFDLHVDDAVAWVVEGVAKMLGGDALVEQQFPFLRAHTVAGDTAQKVATLEAATRELLPLRRLREGLGVDREGVRVLVAVGLSEEDDRFGALFDALQVAGTSSRVTTGLLARWWRGDVAELYARVRQLVALGLVEAMQPDSPRASWVLRVAPMAWGVVRGEAPEGAGVTWRRAEEATRLDDVVMSEEAREAARSIAGLVRDGRLRGLIVRGHRANGRRTLLAAVAREAGLSTLEVEMARVKTDDARWRSLGAMAEMLHAMIVVRAEVGPGERVVLPAFAGFRGVVGVAMGGDGAVEGPSLEGALTVTRTLPDVSTRRGLWARALGSPVEDARVAEAAGYRMTSGVITRVAAGAKVQSAMRDAKRVEVADVRAAYRELPREALEILTARVATGGTWSRLSVAAETKRELEVLELRCRFREALAAQASRAPGTNANAGVRALFQGPSGTGKTLAARLLASVLGRELYRVDLASVVNKYIGETEKNLQAVFSRAEETDVVLLLDEGDALMGRRTSVQSANDRYANLETNYLLQRIESFEGVLLVTTNAVDHIDPAFHRRMDAVVEFRAPEATEREEIWSLHLPEGHTVDRAYLREVAGRCAMSGGQIRNAGLHAALLAMAGGESVGASQLEEALLREYRKAGTVFPLRRRGG